MTFMILYLVRFVFVRLVLPLISIELDFDQSPSEDERFAQAQLHNSLHSLVRPSCTATHIW